MPEKAGTTTKESGNHEEGPQFRTGAPPSALLLLGVGTAQADALKLRLSVESTPGSATQHMLASFRDALQQEMGDAVAIEFFDSGTLGDEIVHMQQVRTGQLDVIPIGSDAVQLDTKWAVFDIPFLFADREAVAKVLDGDIGLQLDDSFQASAGLKVLGFGEIGFRNISNNVRPIVKPEDLDGVKLRVPGSKTRILAFEMLGAAPINMNIGEVYLALQQGTVDGQENPLGNIRKWSWYEVQKYISISRHVYTPITFVMNLRRYEGLSDEQRAAVDRAARAAGACQSRIRDAERRQPARGNHGAGQGQGRVQRDRRRGVPGGGRARLRRKSARLPGRTSPPR